MITEHAVPSATSAAWTLDALLDPITPATFFADHWGRRALHIPGPSEKFGGLFSWADLNGALDRFNAALAARAVDARRLQIVSQGANVDVRTVLVTDPIANALIVDVRELTRRCHAGDTIVLNHLQGDCPAIWRLAAALRTQLHESVNVNAVASVTPNVQGFPRHADYDEVIVLQVEGRKHWRVFAPDAAANDRPSFETVLTTGDLLYVPRGHEHDAVADRAPSLHVAVMIKRRTGVSFLTWLAERFRSDSIWRADLPSALDEEAQTTHLDGLAVSVTEQLRDPAILRQFIADFGKDTCQRRYEFPE